MARKQRDEAPKPSAPAAEAAPLDPMRLVRVRNNGKHHWVGADYRLDGATHIAPGEEGRVSARRADELCADYAHFELLGEVED